MSVKSTVFWKIIYDMPYIKHIQEKMLGKQLIGYGNIQIHIKDEVKKGWYHETNKKYVIVCT